MSAPLFPDPPADEHDIVNRVVYLLSVTPTAFATLCVTDPCMTEELDRRMFVAVNRALHLVAGHVGAGEVEVLRAVFGLAVAAPYPSIQVADVLSSRAAEVMDLREAKKAMRDAVRAIGRSSGTDAAAWLTRRVAAETVTVP